MKLKLYETEGEVTRDLEIDGTLTEVLCVLDALSEAEKAGEELEFEVEEETSRREWVDRLEDAFQDNEELDLFGETVRIDSYNTTLTVGVRHYEFTFSNGERLFLREKND